MAAEARSRPRVLIVFDDLVDVVSAHFADTRAARVSPAPADNHMLLEFDTAGNVVGVEIQGTADLVPDHWRRHPDRSFLPQEIATELDRWLTAHWADLGRRGNVV
jgi:uncharacterized protein YuzE